TVDTTHYKPSLYLALSAIAVCVASCTSDAPVIPDGEGIELSFSTAVSSRATVTTDINTAGFSFAVYGDMTSAATESTDSKRTVIFNNTKVNYDGSKWSYDEPRYWLPQREYSFVAIHPASVIPVGSSAYSNSTLTFSYTIPTSDGNIINRDNLADIIAATHRRRYKDSGTTSASPINLTFFHTMSRINFTVNYEGQPDEIRITKIELEGVAKTATFSLTPAPLTAIGNPTDDYTLTWDGIADHGTLIAEINTDVQNGDTQPLLPDNDAMFMIPQPQNTDIILTISFIADEGQGPEEQTLSAQTSIGGWDAGRAYTYSVGINLVKEQKDMTIDVIVNDWSEGADTDVSVPRI
ncbi:MAG: fimbrillin family protein, partial [Muribaculaceae bacterium]|nr:fimbrillin family protein [Muribaculaceae bacterium]